MSQPGIDQEKDLDVYYPCLKEIKKEPQREVDNRRLSYSEVELETADSYVEGNCSTSCNIKKESFDREETSRGRIEEDSDVGECDKGPSSSKALMVKHEGARWTLDVDAEKQRAEKGDAGRQSTSIPLLAETGSRGWEESYRVQMLLEEQRGKTSELSASNVELKASVEFLQKQLNASAERDKELRKELREQEAMNVELKARNLKLETSNIALQQQMKEINEAMRKKNEDVEPSIFQKRLDALETVLTEKLTIVATPPVPALSIEGRFLLSKELVVAAEQDNWEKMRHLLTDGADIHYKGRNDYTAIHWAAWYDNVNVLQFLIAKGATINVSDIYGNMPLHWAAWNGKVANVEVLVAEGANVNARNLSFWTPLHYAARENQPKTVQALLALGADPSIKDKEGKTARDVTSSSAIRAMLPK